MSKLPQDFFADCLVWDAHAGVFPDPSIDLNLLDNWRSNGTNYISINVGFDVVNWQHTLQTLAAYRNWLLGQADRFVLANTMAEVEQAKKQGKLAVSFDIEGMNALNEDINMVALFHALGVRQMLFAYNLNNGAAGGGDDEDAGVRRFGCDIVAEMNRLGIIVDCSHASFRATMEIMEQSQKPVVFSHSNPTTICDHQRNISDKQIKACAETGGVVGINGMGIFLGDNDSSNRSLVRHICYVCNLVGSTHVGLGLDYSPAIDVDIGEILKSRPDYWPPGQGYDTPAIGHAGPAQLPELAEMLHDHGLGEDDISGILGGNFHRVASAVWQ